MTDKDKFKELQEVNASQQEQIKALEDQVSLQQDEIRDLQDKVNTLIIVVNAHNKAMTAMANKMDDMDKKMSGVARFFVDLTKQKK